MRNIHAQRIAGPGRIPESRATPGTAAFAAGRGKRSRRRRGCWMAGSACCSASSLGLAAGSNSMGMATLCRVYPERIAESPWLLWVSVAAVLATIALQIIPRWSYLPIEDAAARVE